MNALNVLTNAIVNPPVMLNMLTPTNNTHSLSPVVIPNVPVNSPLMGSLEDSRFSPSFYIFGATDDFGTGITEVAFLVSPLMVIQKEFIHFTSKLDFPS